METLELLMKHNILPGYQGYKYIKYILENINDDICDVDIRQLFEAMSKLFNTTSDAIERCVRYALSKSNINYSTKIGLAILQEEYRNKCIKKGEG